MQRVLLHKSEVKGLHQIGKLAAFTMDLNGSSLQCSAILHDGGKPLQGGKLTCNGPIVDVYWNSADSTHFYNR